MQLSVLPYNQAPEDTQQNCLHITCLYKQQFLRFFCFPICCCLFFGIGFVFIFVFFFPLLTLPNNYGVQDVYLQSPEGLVPSLSPLLASGFSKGKVYSRTLRPPSLHLHLSTPRRDIRRFGDVHHICIHRHRTKAKREEECYIPVVLQVDQYEWDMEIRWHWVRITGQSGPGPPMAWEPNRGVCTIFETQQETSLLPTS